MTSRPQLRVTDACTLPSAERPLRVAEWDALLSSSLRHQDRPAPTRLRWVLDADAEEAARDLAVRETACCSFFDFTVGRTPSGPDRRLVVDVEVPPARTDVLDALAARAVEQMRR